MQGKIEGCLVTSGDKDPRRISGLRQPPLPLWSCASVEVWNSGSGSLFPGPCKLQCGCSDNRSSKSTSIKRERECMKGCNSCLSHRLEYPLAYSTARACRGTMTCVNVWDEHPMVERASIKNEVSSNRIVDPCTCSEEREAVSRRGLRSRMMMEDR